MLQLTSDERTMRERLVALAASQIPATITYQQLWDAAMGTPWHDSGAFHRISKMLFHIATYERRLGRPMLTALVVKESGRPGDGFFQVAAEYGLEVTDREAVWEREKARVHDYWARALEPAAITHDRHGPTMVWDPTLLCDTASLAVYDEIQRRV